MCRSKADGGRKCPAQYDPLKKQLRNAKRRAQYKATQEGKTLTPQELKNIETNILQDTVFVKPKTSSNNFYHNPHSSFFQQEYHNETGRELYDNIVKSYEMNETLGIYKTFNIGSLVDNQYFSQETITGVLNIYSKHYKITKNNIY